MRKRRSITDGEEQGRLALEYACRATDGAFNTDLGVFDEGVLEDAVNSIELPPCDPDLKYDLTAGKVDLKLKVNGLGKKVERLIRKEVAHSPVVEEFIRNRAKETNDELFPLKLRSFFFNEYKRLLVPDDGDDGVWGDGLFFGVRDAVENLIGNARAKSAAAAILVHLFLICDLFERPEENADAE